MDRYKGVWVHNINVHGCREDERTERRLLFYETDDSPQSDTGSTYDLSKHMDVTIDVVEGEQPRISKRRKIGEEELPSAL